MTFNQIADWLNEEGYQTPRKCIFKGTHVFSIVKKRLLREKRINKPYELTYGDWYIKEV